MYYRYTIFSNNNLMTDFLRRNEDMSKNDYETSKQYWNHNFLGQKGNILDGKWVKEEAFNNLINTYIKKDCDVLDFGCGSGWALIEIFYTVNIHEGLGIDQSANAINLLEDTIKLSKINHLSFECGDDILLGKYLDKFDSVISINVLDVIPDETIKPILLSIKNSMKKDGYLLIGINPDFPKEYLEEKGYQYQGHYLYKDHVLRGNIKQKDDWIAMFSQFFKFVEYREFSLTEADRVFPRRMFVMQKH